MSGRRWLPPLPRAGAVVAVLGVEAVAFQWFDGAFRPDYSATHSDEAAHFVSALLIHDYVAGGDWCQPLQFARDYYLHYPKVAIGHWPPGFHVLLALWMLVWGTTRASVLACVAVSAVALATAIYAAARRLVGEWAGWFAAVTFLALPLARESTSRVMSEHAAGFLVLVGALCFARFLRSGRSVDSLCFGVVAAAAIMVRGSAWALALVPGLVMLLTRQFAAWRAPALWLSVIPVAVVCVPWYVATRSIWAHDGGMAPGALDFAATAVVRFPALAWAGAGPAIAVAGLAGAVIVLRARRYAGDREIWAALIAVAAATMVLHVTVPAGIEARYVLMVMPTLLLTAAAALDWMAGASGAARRPLVLTVAAVAIGALSVGTNAIVLDRPAPRDYSGIIDALPPGAPGASHVFLIASNSSGEGGMIAAVASGERRPGSLVLRASKVLADEDWMGRRRSSRSGSVDEVRDLLDRIPVTVVVLDRIVFGPRAREYHKTLRAAVAGSDVWTEVGASGWSPARQARVFVRRGAEGGTAAPDRRLIAGLVLPDGLR